MLGKLIVSQLVNDIPATVHYRVSKSQPTASILKQMNSARNCSLRIAFHYRFQLQFQFSQVVLFLKFFSTKSLCRAQNAPPSFTLLHLTILMTIYIKHKALITSQGTVLQPAVLFLRLAVTCSPQRILIKHGCRRRSSIVLSL